MTWINQDKAAIVGIGFTPYYVRGKSYPQTINQLAGIAILNACEDAGISIKQIDGFAYYSGAGAGYTEKFDTASLMETLGIPEVGFTATLTSGGGGMAGAAGLATAGLMNEDCSNTARGLEPFSARVRRTLKTPSFSLPVLSAPDI